MHWKKKSEAAAHLRSITRRNQKLRDRHEIVESEYYDNKLKRKVKCWCLVLKCAALLMRMTSCTHQRAVISTDARMVIRAPNQILGMREMSEADARRIWIESGVYRGLDDDEWMKLMNDIRWLQQLERERQ